MDSLEYHSELNKQILRVIERNPKIENWLDTFPWLTGYLGNPYSSIWFMAENPSTTRAEQVARRDPQLISNETQWAVSEGDKLFRRMLVKHGFKDGEPLSPGGWHCYITDLIKQPDYANQWGAKTNDERKAVARIWSDVLIWELDHSKPKLIVVMGKRTRELLDYITTTRGIRLPTTIAIPHYSFIGSRYDRKAKLNAMAPERIAEYDQQFDMIEKIITEL